MTYPRIHKRKGHTQKMLPIGNWKRETTALDSLYIFTPKESVDNGGF